MLDFIEELVSWSRGRSIYIITLARPELLDRRPTWGAGQRSFTSLALSPLTEEAMRAMLGGLVPGLPDGLVVQIVDRAEGIPLYAVETVRTLLNDGRVQRDGDIFTPIGDLANLDVPESLHALIAARIDALPAGERILVQDAAVLGTSFTLPALAAVARAEPGEIGPMLQHLVQRELLTIDDDQRSPERGQYRFVQGLLREVAYSTLARDERRARHLAAARYYEALGDDELSGVLAQHYVDAYQAHPDGPEGAAVGAQARVALRAAAQRATELGSLRRAHGYLSSALLMKSDPAEELELTVTARDTAADAGMAEVAVEHGERVLALAAELGDDASRRRGIAQIANVLIEGHQERAIAMLNEALAEPGLGAEDAGWVELITVLSKAEMRRVNGRRAVELADEALPVVARQGTDELLLDLLITRGVALTGIGRTMESVAILTGALEVAKRRLRARQREPRVRARDRRSGCGLQDLARRNRRIAPDGNHRQPAVCPRKRGRRRHRCRRVGLGTRSHRGARASTRRARRTALVRRVHNGHQGHARGGRGGRGAPPPRAESRVRRPAVPHARRLWAPVRESGPRALGRSGAPRR
jgi:hypothetical protein